MVWLMMRLSLSESAVRVSYREMERQRLPARARACARACVRQRARVRVCEGAFFVCVCVRARFRACSRVACCSTLGHLRSRVNFKRK
jgi:hypothetical protein